MAKMIEPCLDSTFKILVLLYNGQPVMTVLLKRERGGRERERKRERESAREERDSKLKTSKYVFMTWGQK